MSLEPGDFGARLRRARESRGLSLRDIANVTKISTLVLEALERGDAGRLPGGVFSRAFVREYAKQVGLDPEQAVRDFVEAFPDDLTPLPSQERGAVHARSSTASRSGLGWLGLLVTVLLIVVFVVVNRYVNRSVSSTNGVPAPAATSQRPAAAEPGRGEQVPAAPAAAAQPSTVQPAEGEKHGLPPVAQPVPTVQPQVGPGTTGSTGAAAAELPLHVVLTATAPCWISAKVTRVPGRTLQVGERLQLDAATAIVLTAGDAGGLTYTINDAPGRPLGASGEVVTVVISVRNYRTFVAER
jgi:cytoskeleton protein RodZ